MLAQGYLFVSTFLFMLDVLFKTRYIILSELPNLMALIFQPRLYPTSSDSLASVTMNILSSRPVAGDGAVICWSPREVRRLLTHLPTKRVW